MGDARPVHEGLFTDDGDGPRLLGGRCRACSRYQFPSGELCPYCGAADVERCPLSTEGRVWAWTAVQVPPPGYRGEVPFGFGVVELPEGLRVITRLTESDPARLSFGQAVRLTLVPVHDEEDGTSVMTYAFEAVTR